MTYRVQMLPERGAFPSSLRDKLFYPTAGRVSAKIAPARKPAISSRMRVSGDYCFKRSVFRHETSKTDYKNKRSFQTDMVCAMLRSDCALRAARDQEREDLSSSLLRKTPQSQHGKLTADQ